MVNLLSPLLTNFVHSQVNRVDCRKRLVNLNRSDVQPLCVTCRSPTNFTSDSLRRCSKCGSFILSIIVRNFFGFFTSSASSSASGTVFGKAKSCDSVQMCAHRNPCSSKELGTLTSIEFNPANVSFHWCQSIAFSSFRNVTLSNFHDV